jgi:hypothetical protein
VLPADVPTISTTGPAVLESGWFEASTTVGAVMWG